MFAVEEEKFDPSSTLIPYETRRAVEIFGSETNARDFIISSSKIIDKWN